jgi:hypothetical protein
MIEASDHAALEEKEEQRGHVNPESDQLAFARGLVCAAILSAAMYSGVWLLVKVLKD